MINLGIIGAGRIGKVHIESISTQIPNAKVKMLADPFMDEEKEAWAKGKGVEQVTKDYHEILNNPEIDAVLICSSTDTHASISIEAIEADKHVFCEKPVDHSIEKIRQVQEALKKHPVKYQVGFNRRFDHNFEAVQKAVAAGKIGASHIIRITSRDPEPPALAYIKVSGGMFLDMTIHDFDMARFLAGCNAEEIYVQAAVLVDPAIGEAGDVDTAIITMSYDQRVEVFGSEGMISVGNDTTSSAVISTAEGVTGEKPLYFFLERYMQSYAKEIQCFLQAVEQDTDTPLGIIDGLEAVRMGLAARKSLEEHRPVKISEIITNVEEQE